jgi:hypothetical protein
MRNRAKSLFIQFFFNKFHRRTNLNALFYYSNFIFKEKCVLKTKGKNESFFKNSIVKQDWQHFCIVIWGPGPKLIAQNFGIWNLKGTFDMNSEGLSHSLQYESSKYVPPMHQIFWYLEDVFIQMKGIKLSWCLIYKMTTASDKVLNFSRAKYFSVISHTLT